jgi:DNA-binding beta-propeller fold protein YncE
MGTDEVIRSILKQTPAHVPTFTPDLDRVERRAGFRRNQNRLALGVVLVLLGAGISIPLALLSRLGDPAQRQRPAGSIGTPEILDRIRVPSGAVAVAVTENAVWVVGFDRVARIDPDSNEIVATVRTPGTGDYSAVAVANGAVWVTASRGLLYRIDPDENAVVATIEVGGYPQGIAAGSGSLWVTRAAAGPGDMVRIDPGTDRVAGAPIPLGYGPGPIVYHEGSLWVSNTGLVVGDPTEPIDFERPEMLRVDPVSGDVSPVRGRSGFPETTGAGSVWGVAAGELLQPGTAGGGAVIRVDAASNEVTAVIPVERTQEVGFGDGVVWVMTTPPSSDPQLFIPERRHPGTLVVIDPATDSVAADPLPVPGLQPIDLATGAGSAWVADYSDGTVTRVALE